MELTKVELSAVKRSVRGTIDLYGRYVVLHAETPQMARKQTLVRKYLAALQSAQGKLGGAK
jgi:hypothetical protein